MSYRILYWLLLLINLPLSGQNTEPAFLRDYNKRWVDSVFNSMTTDEKIGQLLMPRGNYSGKAHDVEQLQQWVKEYKIGGIVFFASNPTTQAILTNQLQSLSKTPLLIGQDFEWGVGMRLDSTDRFPYAATIGAMSEKNDSLIEEMGKEIGRQCKRLGVHINYAPVADINNNPNNPVINFRSFGSNKYSVTSKSLAYMRGMQSQHLMCTAKHFPGHGDTDVDSHLDLPVISHNVSRLHENELYPFARLIENGLSGIMTAHLNVPALEPKQGLASTFSKNIIYKLLREELKFKGLTFTDAMEMQGAVKNFPKGEAMVQALLAGNDVLETFMDVPTAVEAIKKAIEQKIISIDAINFKVKKILMAKSWVGLDNYQPIEIKGLVRDLNSVKADLLNHMMTEKSITCLKNELNLLPVHNLDKKIAVLSVESDKPESDLFTMVQNYTDAAYYHIPKNAGDSVIQSVLKQLSGYDLVIAGIHLIDIRASKNYGLTPLNTTLIGDLAQRKNVILCLMGNPFILNKIPQLKDCKTLLLGYQQNAYVEKVTGQMIFGALTPQGKLPFNINDHFTEGLGHHYPSINRLTYGAPEQVGVDRAALYSGIDSIVYAGLTAKAFPGAVIQVAKHGKVIFSKGYGYHTYEAADLSRNTESHADNGYVFIDDAMDNPLQLTTTWKQSGKNQEAKGKTKVTDIFDLASVTKISTSTLSVMQLMSAGKFDLNSTLGTYYPAFKNTDKGDLLMKDLLTHRAGLKAWIPFWRDAIDTVATINKALEQQHIADSNLIVKVHQPGFFKRLFGKKTYKEILYTESLLAKPNLWATVLQPETRTWKKNIFSTTASPGFSTRVGPHMYMNDTYKSFIINQIATSPLKRDQGYVYSDLHYYLYPDMIENLTGKTFENYLNETFHAIGAKTLTFNPYKKFLPDRIVPTEYDSLFRQTLLHGFVHDEGAAMLGGISGHAGLFGTANDLTKLMQMYLQKGNYGGRQFIHADVVEKCTAYQFPEEKNRRGIGFDKKDFDPEIKNAPSLASEGSFGHSGYTGTYTWVDPAFDLVYVFMSNRVYPTRNNNLISSMNIRTAIGDHIIKCINSGKDH